VKAYARLEQEFRSRDERNNARTFGSQPRGSARDHLSLSPPPPPPAREFAHILSLYARHWCSRITPYEIQLLYCRYVNKRCTGP